MANESKDKIVISRYSSLTRYQRTNDGVNQSLTWSSRNGMPRCTVYLDTDNMLLPNKSVDYTKTLIARFTPKELLLTIKKWKELILKGEQGYHDVPCLYPNMVDGKPVGDEKVVSAVIRCGIDTNKLCQLYVKEPNKAEVKFNFEVDKKSRYVWHSHSTASGDIDEFQIGRERFIVYLEELEKIVNREVLDSVVKVEQM